MSHIVGIFDIVVIVSLVHSLVWFIFCSVLFIRSIFSLRFPSFITRCCGRFISREQLKNYDQHLLIDNIKSWNGCIDQVLAGFHRSSCVVLVSHTEKCSDNGDHQPF